MSSRQPRQPLIKKTAQQKLDRFSELIRQHQKRNAEASRALQIQEFEVQQNLEVLYRTPEFRALAEHYYGKERTNGDRLLVHILASKYRDPLMLLEKHDRKVYKPDYEEEYSQQEEGSDATKPVTEEATKEEPVTQQFETGCYESQDAQCWPTSPQYTPDSPTHNSAPSPQCIPTEDSASEGPF